MVFRSIVDWARWLLAFAVVATDALAAEEPTRDQVIAAMVAHTKDTAWACQGDTLGCDHLRSAFPRFLRSDDELVLESLVRINRNLPLHRAALIYRSPHWVERWRETWELHFQIEYYASNGLAYPMSVQCQLDSLAQLQCWVSEGAPLTAAGGKARTFQLTWYRQLNQ